MGKGEAIYMMKLGVVFGGVSSENSISCLSAASVIRNLDKNKYDITAIGITKEGRWYCYPDFDADKIEDGSWEESELIEAVISPDRGTKGLMILKNGKPEAIKLDCIFPVLHGIGGEDGTIQGLFELAGIPYVGCGVAASANAMDKSITKVIAESAGIRQAGYYLLTRHEFERAPEKAVRGVLERLKSFPVFIKPCSQGSSVGVAKAADEVQLYGGLKEAFRYGGKVLVEEFIDGHEIECAVMGNEEPVASTVGEIAPSQEFYTFDAKYNDESSKLYIPARITEGQKETVRQMAVKIYSALGCRGLSRVDFFCTYDNGEIVFNEINTLPGFTSISMYPKLFGFEGIGYTELLDKLIGFAMEERNG